MAVRASPYNNPQIGAALESVAQLFGPPKAADAYAYAKAAEARANSQRLSELFRVAQDPSTSREALDRLGVGAGVFNPNQSYYSVDAAGRISLANNAADNARALEQTRLQQGGENYRETLRPITVAKDATAFLPQPAQKTLGLGPVLQGQISAQPGEIIRTPTGEMIQGAPPLLTTDQVKGRALQQEIDAGRVPMSAIVNATVPPGELEKVLTPTGPQLTTRSEAIGKTPYDKPTAERIVGNYHAPGGAIGVAVAGVDGKLHDSQTGAELPPGVQTFRSQAQGSVEDVTKTTQGALERRKLQFDRLLNTADLLEKTIAQGSGNQGLVGVIRGTAQDAIATMHELGRLANVDTSDLEARAGAAVGDPDVAAQLMNRDGTISPVRLLSHVLASQGADVLAGGNRTSNQQINQMIAALGQDSVLANPQRTRETLATLRAWIASQRSADENAFGANKAPAPPTTPSGYKILNVR